MRLRPECGLLHVGPAACLAGRLTLLPGIMGAPAQVLPETVLPTVLTHPLVCCKCYASLSVCACHLGYSAFTILLGMHMTWRACRHILGLNTMELLPSCVCAGELK